MARTSRVAAARGLALAAVLTFAAAAGARAQGVPDDSIPPRRRPDYLVPWLEPSFGTILTRIANDAGKPTTPVVGVWGADARHTYGNQEPWNADHSLIIIENRVGGTPSRLLLDGDTYTPIAAPCDAPQLFDFRWHPSRAHAHELINVDVTGTKLSWIDIQTCTSTRTWNLPIAVNYGIGSGSGNPSNDGRFVALASERGMFVVDMDPQPPFAPYPNVRIGPVYSFPPCSLKVTNPTNCALGLVTISPSGRYVDLKYSGSDDSTADLHRIFDVDSASLALSPRRMDAAALRCGSYSARPNGWVFPLKHSDVAVDPFDNDEDVLIGGRSCPGSRLGRVVKVRLRDGQVTALTDPKDEAAVAHVSTRNLDRPGWVYVSYFVAPGKRYSGEILAVKLDGSGEMEHYAHYHGLTPGCYRCEAHPVPSRDGKRVMFASNWATDCGDSCSSASEVKDYVAEAVTDTTPPPPPPPPLPDRRFLLAGLRPNPAGAFPSVVFSLQDGNSARLELVDLLGRIVLRRDLDGLGPGQHEAVLDRSRVRAGVYWLRLFESGHMASARIVLLN